MKDSCVVTVREILTKGKQYSHTDSTWQLLLQNKWLATSLVPSKVGTCSTLIFSAWDVRLFDNYSASIFFSSFFFSLHTDFELCLLYVKLTVLFCRFLNTCMMKAIDLSLRKILLFSLPLPLPLPSPFGETSFCASSHCSCQHAPSSFMLVTATSTMSLGSWVSVRVSSFLRTVECQKLLETLNDAEFCWLHITVVLLFNRTCQLGWISWKHLWILTFSSYSNLWRMCLACCSRI